MSDDLEQARELLSAASGSWELADDKYARTRASLATAHAAVDAAETARAMHTCLEGILQAVDALVSERPATVEGDEGMCPNCLTPWKCNGPHTAPDAPATPQVGEVWEDTKDGETVEVLEGPPYDGAYPCRRIGSPWTDPIYRPVLNGDWRRVSPAPAPLTEREVTAEAEGCPCEGCEDEGTDEYRQREVTAEAQGVKPEIVTFPLVAESLDEGTDEDRRRERAMFFGAEPASDTDIARDSVAVLALQRHHRERYYRLIARVRAEQARADAAEAQVAFMRPVVDAAVEYEETHPSTEGHTSACRLVCPAVRAYREATRDA